MTFPTKADIEFFKEAKRIQELWEPKDGDFALDEDGDVRVIFESSWHKDEIVLQVFSGLERASKSKFLWLPRQGQLQEMLVEKEGYVLLDGPWSDGYNVGISDQPTVDPDDCKWFTGPTPSIALGKCLLEVLGD